MSKRFFLLRLFISKTDRLEKLRRLETKLCTAIPEDRPGIEQRINAVVDEIADLSKATQELRADRSPGSTVLWHVIR